MVRHHLNPISWVHWVLRTLRGPGWFLRNVVRATWEFDIRDMIARKHGSFIRRTIFRLARTIYAIGQGAFIFILWAVVGVAICIGLPLHWIYQELRDIWFDD